MLARIVWKNNMAEFNEANKKFIIIANKNSLLAKKYFLYSKKTNYGQALQNGQEECGLKP